MGDPKLDRSVSFTAPPCMGKKEVAKMYRLATCKSGVRQNPGMLMSLRVRKLTMDLTLRGPTARDFGHDLPSTLSIHEMSFV